MPTLSSGVYQIATGENLAWFANAVNSGSQTIKGKLTADIQLNYSGSTSNEWTPIGTSSKPFKGLFDGDGHTISGVYINSVNDYQGLFGCVILPEKEYPADVIDPDVMVSTTTVGIQNLNVTDSVIIGKQNIGGIVGYASELGIKNCSFSGSVLGTSNSVGGIIGWASSDVTVVQSHSSGSVTGNQRVGGIAGYQNGNSVVTTSYSDAEVQGTLNVGGITGTLSSSFLEGCFFLGSLSANDRAGGIAGYSAFGTIKGVYADAEMTVLPAADDAGGAVGVIFDGKYGSVFYNYDKSGLDGPVGAARTSSEMQASSFIKELNAAKVFYCFDYTNINSGYPVLVWMIASDVWLGELSKPTLSGSTYLISKPSELAWFSALVNGKLSGYNANPSANARVTDDLLMNLNLNDDSFSAVEWTPIGTSEYPYTGTFDGGGYNIAGLYTDRQSGENSTNTGLFGYIGTGTVKNTIVIDGKISGTENVGGIAGYLYGGTIQNCCCASEVSGKKAVGGIVGFIGYNTSSSCTVSLNCMLGTVEGVSDGGDESDLMNVGGIVGYNNRATIDRCFTYGKINAPLARNVGGLIGYNSNGTLTSSYNTSLYVLGKTYIGGLVGMNNNSTVNYCYTSGKVSGTGSTNIGIAFGYTTGSVSSNSYDSTYMTLSLTNTDGAVSKTQSQMTGASSVSNMGLSSGNYTAKADDTYFYYFPQLSAFTYSSYKVVKNGSFESVKRVRDIYNARVQIDGRADTYYETLSDAVSYAQEQTHLITPTVCLVRDTVLDSTVDVTGTVRLFSEENITLTRNSTLKSAMFNVTGSLTVGSDVYGNDSAPYLTVDGNAVLAKQSAFTVQTGGKLCFESGIKVANFKSANSVRGAVISNQGDLKISGGVFGDLFKPNIGLSSGGVIYSYEGNAEISGGLFEYNEANQGAVIYNNDGYAEIKGGLFRLNTGVALGGVSVSYGIYAQTVIGGKAEMMNNSSSQGGAVSAQNYSVSEIAGGTITANTASSTGGAVHIKTGAEVVVSGGNIYSNTSNGSGKGIYTESTLTLKGKAQIDSNNDVYLPAGNTLSIEERLTCQGFAAVVTPETYAEGTVVLDGEAMMSNYRKIGVSNSAWHTLADGTITSSEGTAVAKVDKSGTGSVEYVSLASAFASVESGEDAIIVLLADTSLNSEIKVNGNVTLLCDDNTSFSITRDGSYNGVMFNVMPDAVLHLGESINDSDQQSRADFKSGTEDIAEGLIIIDGGKTATGVTGKASINVQYNAELYMHEGAIIQNGLNPETSATDTGIINVSGTMYMFGGTIRNNSAFSGAICVMASGNLNTYGGVIHDNTSVRGGSAVYALGTVTRFVHSYEYKYIETLYDSENPDVIIGQSEPVKVSTTKTDIYVDKDNNVFLSDNMIYTGISSSEIFIRNIDDAPPETDVERCVITLSPEQYTVGAVAVTGEDVAGSYMYFDFSADGYYITSAGLIGINKLVLKDTSAFSIKRPENFISGFNLGKSTPTLTFSEFKNNKTNVKFYKESGTGLRNSDLLTTGMKIRLLDSKSAVIDELTIVVYGDINSDCQIDGQDAVIIRAIAGGMLSESNITSARMEASDVNRDSEITDIDAETAEECGIGLQTIEQ